MVTLILINNSISRVKYLECMILIGQSTYSSSFPGIENLIVNYIMSKRAITLHFFTLAS